MRRGVSAGEMVTDRTQWPPLLTDEEFAALEEVLAKTMERQKLQEGHAEPIEVGQLWQRKTKEIMRVLGVTSDGVVCLAEISGGAWCPKLSEFYADYRRLPYRREASP